MMRETVTHPDAEDEPLSAEGCFVLELSNSADDPDVSIARARVPSVHCCR
jgi:hypothetical protein